MGEVNEGKSAHIRNNRETYKYPLFFPTFSLSCGALTDAIVPQDLKAFWMVASEVSYEIPFTQMQYVVVGCVFVEVDLFLSKYVRYKKHVTLLEASLMSNVLPESRN